MSFDLTIVTPECEVFRGLVETVVLPGSEGDFGVLEQHERFLAPLRIGEAQLRVDGEIRCAAFSDGFAEVGPDYQIARVASWERAWVIETAHA